MHVLIVTNNFWVGGREEYIIEYTTFLANYDFEFSLIANRLACKSSVLDNFVSIQSAETNDYSQRWRTWLNKTEKLFTKKSFQLIWAHHFDLLPAWIFSRLYNIPLLVTFHGPLIHANRPNDPMQALGMVLCIYRGDIVSGVSAEIVEDLYRLHPGLQQKVIIPNTCSVVDTSSAPCPNYPLQKFVLITRREKLTHIRAAVLLFHLYRKRVPNSRLVIAAGSKPDDFSVRGRVTGLSTVRFRELVRLLGAQWCLEQGFGLLKTLLRINYIGYTDKPRSLIQEADVVLGMGRVVVDGIVHGKAVVLVGYDQAHCLITSDNLSDIQWSNFSGRKIKTDTLEEICDALYCYNQDGLNLPVNHLDSLSTPINGMNLEKVILDAEDHKRTSQQEKEMALQLSKELQMGISEKELFSRIGKELSSTELASFYELSVG